MIEEDSLADQEAGLEKMETEKKDSEKEEKKEADEAFKKEVLGSLEPGVKKAVQEKDRQLDKAIEVAKILFISSTPSE